MPLHLAVDLVLLLCRLLRVLDGLRNRFAPQSIERPVCPDEIRVNQGQKVVEGKAD